jgi:NADH pyrophosphatase NudC (nudix superfamily)
MENVEGRAPRYCAHCASPLVDREEGGRMRRACPDPGCGHVEWQNPVPVVAALVEHEGRVVLVRAHGWPEKWHGLVTGFLEQDESVEAAVLREVDEELGVRAEIVAPIGLYAFPRKNQLILAYHVRAAGKIRLGDELASFRHVAPEDLRPWPHGTGDAVRDWLARRARG